MRVQAAAARETARQAEHRNETRRFVRTDRFDSFQRRESDSSFLLELRRDVYRNVKFTLLAFGYTSAKIYFDERNRARPTSIVAQIVNESEAGMVGAKRKREEPNERPRGRRLIILTTRDTYVDPFTNNVFKHCRFMV